MLKKPSGGQKKTPGGQKNIVWGSKKRSGGSKKFRGVKKKNSGGLKKYGLLVNLMNVNSVCNVIVLSQIDVSVFLTSHVPPGGQGDYQ